MKYKIEDKVKHIGNVVRKGMEAEAKEVDEADLKRFLKSERKRMKKLKHAGVKDYLEERYS